MSFTISSYTISCVSASDRRRSIGWRIRPLRERYDKEDDPEMAEDLLPEILSLSSSSVPVCRTARRWEHVAVSPRGDLRMPSDASAAIWLAELEGLGK